MLPLRERPALSQGVERALMDRQGRLSQPCASRRRATRRRGAIATAARAAAALGVGMAAPPAGAQTLPPGWQVRGVPAPTVIHGATSSRGQTARTDPALLAIADDSPVSVMVKL